MKITAKNDSGFFNETNIQYGHSNDIMNEIPNVINWLKSKDLPAHISRYSKYKRYIDDFYAVEDRDNPSEEKFKKLNWAFHELFEIVQIYKCFSDQNSNNFNERLEKVVSGQDMMPDTLTAKNDNSRDFLYELLIASEFYKRGFNICFNNDADIVAIRGLDVIMAECKRLSSNNSLERNIKKAGEQLNRRERKDTIGLIFIDITSCILDKIPIFEYHSDAEIISRVRTAMDYYQKENQKVLEHLSSKYLESAFGICLTFRRTLWLGRGEYLRVNYFTDTTVFLSKCQTKSNENKLRELLKI